MKNILNIKKLSELFNYNKYGRYFEDTELPFDKTVQYTVDCILKLISEKHAVYRIRNSPTRIEGMIVFRKSPWDTEHFKKNTAIIDSILVNQEDQHKRKEIAASLIEKFLQWCKQETIQFVVAKVPSLDLVSINEFLHSGFDFIESWIFNKIDLRKCKINDDSLLPLRLAKESDLAYMLEYSKDAYITQRFHADHHIRYDQAEGLYEKWIRNSIHDANQKILVYDHNGTPSAFMTYYVLDLNKYYNLKFAMWKMALISPLLRGQGVGKAFFYSLFDHHLKEGLDIVDSGLSLRNIVSLNTHNKVNFKVVSTLVTLHLWM